MQLGARWRTGDPPHRSVPEALRSAISAAEHLHPGARAWTLTWLEGRPRAQLDSIVEVRRTAAGIVETIDVWHSPTPEAAGHASDDDDDDWLVDS